MLNTLWPIFIIISILYAIICGNLNQLNVAINSSAENAVNLTLVLLGTTCLWSGIMEIVSNTSIMRFLSRILRPIILYLFPKADQNEKAFNKIVMNVIANILGLGNAATSLGIQAIEELQKDNLNKDILSDNMMILIVLNTASLQIIPTTVIAIRTAFGSDNPTKIIVPVWFSTICAGIVGVLITKLLIKIDR